MKKATEHTFHGSFRVLCIVPVLVVIFSVMPLAGQAKKAPSAPVLDSILSSKIAPMLQHMDTLIRDSKKDDAVSQTWMTVRSAMAQSKIRFSLGPDSGGDLIGKGAVYQPKADGPSTILLSRDLMQLWDTQEGLVMSFVLNALVFAEAHFKDSKKFMATWQEPVRAFLNSMDALYVQALFCRDYLGVFPGKEAGYAGFLAGGINLDGLSSVSIYVLGADQMLILALMDLTERMNGGMAAEVWYDRVENLMGEVEDHLDQAEEAMNPPPSPSPKPGELPSPGPVYTKDDLRNLNYIAGVGALTMVRYGVSIINGQMDFYKQLQAPAFQSRREALAKRVENLVGKLPAYSENAISYRKDFLKPLLP